MCIGETTGARVCTFVYIKDHPDRCVCNVKTNNSTAAAAAAAAAAEGQEEEDSSHLFSPNRLLLLYKNTPRETRDERVFLSFFLQLCMMRV